MRGAGGASGTGGAGKCIAMSSHLEPDDSSTLGASGAGCSAGAPLPGAPRAPPVPDAPPAHPCLALRGFQPPGRRAESPEGLVTSMSARPTIPGGTSTVSRVAEAAMTTAGLPPMRTDASGSKSLPNLTWKFGFSARALW